mmetsp:Transcript_11683/g.28664  ORF Transcript_11683/g.28664 Transcript_11683/m.28664 type:complete len:251 (+) Transcript_11683:858-1610(+)
MVDTALSQQRTARATLSALYAALPFSFLAAAAATFSASLISQLSLAFSWSTSSTSNATVAPGGTAASRPACPASPYAYCGGTVMTAFSPFFIFITPWSSPSHTISSSVVKVSSPPSPHSSNTVPSPSSARPRRVTLAPSLGRFHSDDSATVFLVTAPSSVTSSTLLMCASASSTSSVALGGTPASGLPASPYPYSGLTTRRATSPFFMLLTATLTALMPRRPPCDTVKVSGASPSPTCANGASAPCTRAV